MINYFDERAKNYLKKSHRFPWTFFRKKELALVEKFLSPEKESSLIDLGCGAGFYTISLKKKYNLKVLGIDSSASMIQALSEMGIEGKVSKLEDLVVDKKFDNALAAGVLEFVPNAKKALEQISMTIHLKGKLVILIPMSGPFGFVYKQFHHLQKCPTYIRDLHVYEQWAEMYGLKKISSKRATLISSVIVFEKN